MNGLLTQTSLLQKAVLSMAFMVLTFPTGGKNENPWRNLPSNHQFVTNLISTSSQRTSLHIKTSFTQIFFFLSCSVDSGT